MKEDMIMKLNAVIRALNSVTICGEDNMDNMKGSIVIIRDVLHSLQSAEFSTNDNE